MALGEELKKIKHIYGEEFMKICRENFPIVLEQEGLLTQILENNFANNARTLAKDIKEQDKIAEFKDYIYSKFNKYNRKKAQIKETIKNPYDLLKDAGYTLYECHSEEEIQSFRKYYARGESLCTFNGGRLDKCICFWAIKDDAEQILRENFIVPNREDAYSTSVLAIQFDKFGKCMVSIKSRYNHVVPNPDCTYGNDLDRIAEGLSISFEKMLEERGYEFTGELDAKLYLNNYRVGSDGRFYKYNIREFGACYCPGNIIISHEDMIEALPNPEQQVLIDNYILDLKEKTITKAMAGMVKQRDSFPDAFKNIEKIDRQKDKKTGETTFTIYMKDKKPAIIVVDSLNQIVEYSNPNLTELGDGFMRFNKTLRKLDVHDIKKIGANVLFKNTVLTEMDFSEVRSIGASFLSYNEKIEEIVAPKLKKVTEYFLRSNDKIQKFVAPELKTVGDEFLAKAKTLKTIDMPRLESVGAYFLQGNETLTKIDLPKLTTVGHSFLFSNKCIKEANLPKLQEVGYSFMFANRNIEKIELPNLTKVSTSFMHNNNKIKSLRLPKLQKVDAYFMAENTTVEDFKAPRLNSVANGFMCSNPRFKKIRCHSIYLRGIDLAKLDKENNVTKEEMSQVGKAIEWFRKTTKNLLNKDKDDR